MDRYTALARNAKRPDRQNVRPIRSLPGLLISLAILSGLTSDRVAAQDSERAAAASSIEARAIAMKLADLMAERFVYADIGNKYASMLRENATRDKYERLTAPELARTLTADMLALHQDGHLRVMAGTGTQGSGGEGIPARRHDRKAPTEMPRWVAPGVVVIRFNLFTGDQSNLEIVRKFVEASAHAKIVVFDLRTHDGGGLDEMDVLFAHLYSRETSLVRMATRQSVFAASGSPFSNSDTLRLVDGDPLFTTQEHRARPAQNPLLKNAKVYVLTSQSTASAAEHFALAIKSSGRGMLVGTRTAGANHFGDFASLGGGLTAFIPVGRTFDPATGKDWEGSGVTPDLETAADDALAAVLRREGIQSAITETQPGFTAITPRSPDRSQTKKSGSQISAPNIPAGAAKGSPAPTF